MKSTRNSMFTSQLKILSIAFSIALVLLTAACTSSNLNVRELPSSADPSKEITRVEANLEKARLAQQDVLAPSSFQGAVETLEKAKDARSSNASQTSVLHKISLAQAYLDKANEVSAVSNQLLSEVKNEREGALRANVQEHFPKDLEALDSDLRSVTRDVEYDRTSAAEKQKDSLKEKYAQLALKSLKEEELGQARENMKTAVDEGAKKWAPQTLTWAEARLKEDEGVIDAAPKNKPATDRAGADALQASERLLKMTREAKRAKQMTPEELAQQREAEKLKLNQADERLNAVSGDLAQTEEALSGTANENKELRLKAWVEQKYEAARKEFSKEEADVYKQGNKLLIRLKGLQFKTNKAGIESNSYPLLKKVEGAMREFGAVTVAVEGHTDATGSKTTNAKLSNERAESVRAYFVANKAVSPEKITSKGLGDTVPLASNKTTDGRAQNRRVDVIVTPQG